MALVAAVLFGCYLLGILYALKAPAKQPDPQRGQAIGCLMIVAAGIGLLLLIVGVGWWFQLNWLVTGLFWIAVFPAISLVGSLLFNWINRRGR